MARNLKTVIQIDANGKPASSEIAKVKGDVSDLDSEVGGLADKFGEVGDVAGELPGPLGDIGGMLNGPAGIAAGAAAIGYALADAAAQAIELGKNTQTAMIALDTSAETASRLISVFGEMGVEADEVVDIALQTTDVLNDNADLAEKLGLNLGDAVEPVDALTAAFNNWDLLTPTQRMQLFGEEGVRQIANVRRAGGDLNDLLANVNEINVIDDQELTELQEAERSIQELKTAWEGVKTEIGLGVVGAVNDFKTSMTALNDLVPVDLFGSWTDDIDLVNLALNGTIGNLGAVIDKWSELDGGIEVSEGKVNAWKGAIDVAAGATEDLGDTAEDTFATDVPEYVGVADRALDAWRGRLNIDKLADDMLTKLGEVRDGNVEEFGAAELAVIDWLGAMEDVPYETLKNIEVAFRDGDIETILSELTTITQPRTTQIQLNRVITTSYQPGTGGPPADIPSPEGRATTNNVNITMAAQPSARELSNMVNQWTRNG